MFGKYQWRIRTLYRIVLYLGKPSLVAKTLATVFGPAFESHFELDGYVLLLMPSTDEYYRASMFSQLWFGR